MNRSAILAELKRGAWAMCPKALQSFWTAVQPALARGAAADDDARGATHNHTPIDAQKYTPAQDRKTAQQPGTVVVLPLRGIIDYRSSFFLQFFGGTSVEDFAKKFSNFVNDSQVKAIILDIDSPGGNVSGCTELAKMIFEAREKKTIVAQVNPLACSAAYWIGSAATEMVITPSGEAGSIGVYTLHEDISKYLDDLGIKETFVYAGKIRSRAILMSRWVKMPRHTSKAPSTTFMICLSVMWHATAVSNPRMWKNNLGKAALMVRLSA